VLVDSLQEQEGRQPHVRFQFIDGEPMREPALDEHCNLKQRFGCRFPAETASENERRNCVLRRIVAGRVHSFTGCVPLYRPLL